MRSSVKFASSAIAMVFLLILIGCAGSEEPLPTNETTGEPHWLNEPIQAASQVNLPNMTANKQDEQQTLYHAPLPIPKGIEPVLLEIPAINLEAEVVPVGMQEDGEMEAPEEFDKVGFFQPGVKPGNKGNAVIAGHLDHYTGPAIFFYIKDLEEGDHVYVTDEAGTKLTFKVTEVASYKTNESPLEKIFGDADQHHLNLITCAGTFNRKTQLSSHRLVVFTELIEEL